MDRPTTSTEPPPSGTPEPHERPGLRSLRDLDVRVFSSASDAPRARRPTDVVLVALALLTIGGMTLVAPGPGALDTATQRFVQALPGLFGWFWETAYDVLFLWAIVLIAIPIVARKRTRMLVGELLAVAITFIVGSAVAGLVGVSGSESVRAIASSDPPARYPAMRVAIAAAVVVAASPHVSRPLRRIGRIVLILGAAASVAVGVALPSGVLAGFAVGIGVATLVHLLLGSPGGRLSLDQARLALAHLGVTAVDLRYAPLSPSGVAIVLGRTDDGRSIRVKIYGRDAWDGQLITSVWSSVWNRGETPRVGGRLEQVEHEAFVTLLAERSGIAVQPVLTAGLAEGRDAIVVLDTGEGRPMSALGAADVDDATLARIWELDAALFEARIAHGQLDADAVVVRPDGTPAVGDLGGATVSAARIALQADRAQLLVATALTVGAARAVRAAHAALGNDEIAAVLPYLQPAALSSATRRALSDADWKLDDLRTQAAQTAGVEVPKLEQLRRVTLGSIVMVVVIGLVAWAVISAIANVGLDNLVQEFKAADLAWLAAAIAVVPLVGVPQAFGTIGSCIRPIRFGPVLALQWAIAFIALAVPSSAARIALEIRFFGKLGMSSASAVAVGAIDSVSGFIVEVSLIALILLSGLASLHLHGVDGETITFTGKWLLIGAIALAVLVTIVIAIPRLRGIVAGKAAEVKQDIGDSLGVFRSPTKVVMIFGGNLLAVLLYSVVLGLCVHAFGHSLSFADLVLTYTVVTIFAGFMPVPGGMGVAEAGYTAVLVALGLPHTAALSVAMTFRLATYYLPPIWGGFAMGWLRRREYI
ncbi:MAG TPA: lysylphosphatidylglycerol synthase transmembrane domain-containing protein [Actinomycetota bacterium]|nr:lysylphosphatidylglycerol synthase transmembrane domain-containing protein [Actinomycetota bacterium]